MSDLPRLLVHEDGRYAVQHSHRHWHRRLADGGYESTFVEPEKWAEQGWRELLVAEQGTGCEHLDGPYRQLLIQRYAALALHSQVDCDTDGVRCTHCFDDDGIPMPWPCPTVVALGGGQ